MAVYESIFDRRDESGDELDVWNQSSFLLFHNTRRYDGELVSVRLNHPDALRLHAALGEWLYPVHTDAQPNKSLIEEMIAKAVKEQVSAVLPLRLSSIVIAGDGPERCSTVIPKGARLSDQCAHCGYLWAIHPGGVTDAAPGLKVCQLEDCSLFQGAHFEHDPEPQAVGHPEEPEPQHGRLMAELPKRKPTGTWDDRVFFGATPFCEECSHSWVRHDVAEGRCGVRVNGVHCGCATVKRVRP